MKAKNLSASEFADLIGVKRANVSHVLSGRNKPSLEFVLRLGETFEEIDLNTLLLNNKNQFQNGSNENNSDEKYFENAKNKNEYLATQNNDSKEIDRIVIFFKNGSFKEYRDNETS